jgi:hypothetical protein
MVPVAGAGSPLHRYHMGRYSNMGVVEGEEEERKRIEEAECKSCSKSV